MLKVACHEPQATAVLIQNVAHAPHTVPPHCVPFSTYRVGHACQHAKSPVPRSPISIQEMRVFATVMH